MLKSPSDACLRGGKSGLPIRKTSFKSGVASLATLLVGDLGDRSDSVVQRHSRLGVTGGSRVPTPKSPNDSLIMPTIVQSLNDHTQMMPAMASVQSPTDNAQIMLAIVQSPKSPLNDPPMIPATVQSLTDSTQIMPAVAKASREEPQKLQLELKAKARVFTGIENCRRAEGMYFSCGESLKGRRVYLHEKEKLIVFYRDGRDGEEYAGWCCGESIVSDNIVGFCESSAQACGPPVSGWRFPVNCVVQVTTRFDICELPLEAALRTYAQREKEVIEEERQKRFADELQRQREAAEKERRLKKAREARQKKFAEEARNRQAAELHISGWLGGLDLGIPPWLRGGLGTHLFLSGTLMWEREKKARLDFFGMEWKVPNEWVFGYGLGLQALEATLGLASDFPATVQFKWGNRVKAPENTSLASGGVTTDIAHFLASFFAKHDGNVLISGHSEGVVYALLLFRALQQAADGNFRLEGLFQQFSLDPETVFKKQLMELAEGPNSQETLRKWARNARALVTGPFAVAFDREWAEYFLVKHQSQVAAVVSSVAMNVHSPDGSGPWESSFEYVGKGQKKVAKALGRIPDLMYSFSYGEGRCLAHARVKAIFEEYAFLLEARLSNSNTEGVERKPFCASKNIVCVDDQGRVLHRGLHFLQMVGPSFKWDFDPDYFTPGVKGGATWELHQLEAYRRIAKLLPVTLNLATAPLKLFRQGSRARGKAVAYFSING